MSGVYVTPQERDAWRKQAEAAIRVAGLDEPAWNAPAILRLLDQLEAPCGSCHPCDNWANQTWVNAGRRLPHLHEYEELEQTLARVQAKADEWMEFANTKPGPKAEGARIVLAEILLALSERNSWDGIGRET